MPDPANIVIRGPNWLGDAVMSIPAMRAVRRRFPRAKITLLVRPWVAGLFRPAAYCDALWTHPAPGVARWIPTARRLRRGGFDAGLLFPNSFESAWTLFAGGVSERIGYATDRRGLLLTRAVNPPGVKRHQADYYLDLVEAAWGDAAGRPPAGGGSVAIGLAATPEERAAARRLLARHGVDGARPILVINPGAAFGSAKRWREDRFAAAADALGRELGLEAVVIGSAAEREIGNRIAGRMRRRLAVLSGETSLEALKGVLAEAALVVTNDSGPMHLAAALGAPTVAIFGSTDPEVTRPIGRRTRIVRHPVACSPCLLRECPIDHPCMEHVTVDAVCEAAMALYRETPAGAANDHEAE